MGVPKRQARGRSAQRSPLKCARSAALSLNCGTRACSAAVKWPHTRCHVREQGATLTIIGNPSVVPQKHINRLQLAPTSSTEFINFSFSAKLLYGRPTARLHISRVDNLLLDLTYDSKMVPPTFFITPGQQRQARACMVCSVGMTQDVSFTPYHPLFQLT